MDFSTEDINGTTAGIIVISLMCFYFLYRKLERKNDAPSGFRPLPSLPRLPLLGSLPFLPTSLTSFPDFFMKTSRRIGPIYSFYVGNTLTVVLNGKDALASALVNHPTDFAGKQALYLEKQYTNPNFKGLGMRTYDEVYKKQHKLVLSILKEYGFGLQSMLETRILIELEQFTKEIKKNWCGISFNPLELLSASMSSVILNIMLGKRFDYSDRELKDLNKNTYLFAKHFLPLISVFPFLAPIPAFRRRMKIAANAVHEIKMFIGEQIDDCLGDATSYSFVRRYVEKEGGVYDREELVYILRDLISGGTDTTANSLLWSFVVLANHPHIQKNLQDEIDSVVPKERFPTMDDKAHLPYVEASTLELQRWKTVVPLATPHVTMCDTEVDGFFVPKGSTVVPNLYSVHMNREEWPEPDQFRPERFLNEAGEVVGRDRILPFGLGKRSCVGEVLARQELFLFFAGIVQHFHVLPPTGKEKIEVREVIEHVLSPTPFEVRFEPRFK